MKQIQRNILWTGREYYSLENCLINTTDSGTTINSAIVGLYQQKLYRVEYRIQTNPEWETMRVEVSCQHDNLRQAFAFEGDGKGSWLLNGNKEDSFSGCIDVDIPLTPFTNSLPINRLKMKAGNEQTIRVIYIDLLEREIKPVQQKYICISQTEYHYENIPNDFEANIIVDESGFVVDYPSLFVRTFVEYTKY